MCTVNETKKKQNGFESDNLRANNEINYTHTHQKVSKEIKSRQKIQRL